MRVKQLVELLEAKYPLNLGYEWDFNGLQIGEVSQTINKVLVVLDLTPKALEFALNNDVNFIISHHPFIFGQLDDELLNPLKKKMYDQIIANQIACFALHTNLDKASDGLNYWLACSIGLDKGQLLENECLWMSESYTLTIEELVSRCKKAWQLSHVLFHGKDLSFDKIMICGGSGGSYIQTAIDLGYDLLITGDVAHHELMVAYNAGLNLMIVPHHIEKLMTSKVAETINELADELEVLTYQETSEYQVL